MGQVSARPQIAGRPSPSLRWVCHRRSNIVLISVTVIRCLSSVNIQVAPGGEGAGSAPRMNEPSSLGRLAAQMRARGHRGRADGSTVRPILHPLA